MATLTPSGDAIPPRSPLPEPSKVPKVPSDLEKKVDGQATSKLAEKEDDAKSLTGTKIVPQKTDDSVFIQGKMVATGPEAEKKKETSTISSETIEQKLSKKYQYILEKYPKEEHDSLLRIFEAAEKSFDAIAVASGKVIHVEGIDYVVKFDQEAGKEAIQDAGKSNSLKNYKLHIIRLPKYLQTHPEARSTEAEQAKEFLGSGHGGVVSKVHSVSQAAILPFKVGRIGREVEMLQYVHRNGEYVGFQHLPITWVDIIHNSKSIKAMLSPEIYIFNLIHFFSNGSLTNETRILACIQLFQHLNKVWEMGVRHGDIKPENIFVDSEGRFRLGDFGTATKFEEKAIFGRGAVTKYYYAKGDYAQLLSTKDLDKIKIISKQRDLFALGMVFYAILTGKLPYESDEDDYPTGKLHEEHLQQRSYPKELIDLIKGMTELDFNKRIPFDKALEQMAFIQKSMSIKT